MDFKTEKAKIDGKLIGGRKYRNAIKSLLIQTDEGTFVPVFMHKLLGGALTQPHRWAPEFSSDPELVRLAMDGKVELENGFP